MLRRALRTVACDIDDERTFDFWRASRSIPFEPRKIMTNPENATKHITTRSKFATDFCVVGFACR